MRFDHLSSHALTARLVDLVATERQTVVDFLLHLVEFERRGLHLELGYSSLFGFLVEHLKLTKASAFRRTEAARLIARYPVITDYLRDGRLSLTTLVELRKALTDENHRAVLDRAAGKTEDEVRELVAALAPQEAPPDLFRRLPTPTVRATADRAVGAEPDLGPPGSGPEPADFAKTVPAARGAASVQPISQELRVLRVTVGWGFTEDLGKVKALLSHTIPDGDLERILHECIRRTIAACEKRRRGSDRPRPRKAAAEPAGRHIPTDVRRAVWARDGASCAFVGATGKRCGATHQLELHHVIPFARGGLATVENIQLRCRGHNAYAAQADYGRDHMRFARSRSARERRETSSPGTG